MVTIQVEAVDASVRSSLFRLMKVSRERVHGNVNVFEDATRSDAEDPVAGFHQVVAFTATVLAAEGSVKVRLEFSCLALTKNRVRYVFHSTDFMARCPELFLAEEFVCDPSRITRLGRADFFVKGEAECTFEWPAGQFRILVHLRKKNGRGIRQI